MYTPCINTNQQTNDIFHDNFVCLQVIVHANVGSRTLASIDEGTVSVVFSLF